MAYSKKTWKARQGTGLNKFILGTVDSQGRQTITNLPDQITESGDALSADNFNDFEDRIEDGFTDVNEQLESHTSNTNNPHGVTKAQVGLGNVDNTSDLNKPISNATQIALDSKANASSLESHTSNIDNPHGVTKTQIGLGNVDNTSDLDKPISTNAQNALNLKADRDIDGIAGNIAMLDSNGNSIDSNFPISEVARKDIVTSNSKRIANLEDKSAPYTIEYPSDDYGKGEIPASIEKGAVVKSVDGNTRPFCQLAPSRTVKLTNNGTGNWANGGASNAFIDTTHVYLISCNVSISGTGLVRLRYPYISSAFTEGRNYVLASAPNATNVGYQIYAESGDTCTAIITEENCIDLTLYCEGQNVPTTVAEALALNPEFGKFHAFDTGSLVKLKVGGYRFTSRNLIAESNIELGGISPVGVPYEATSGTWWRSADFIEVKPARTYYVKLPSGYTTANANIYAYYYDEDGNFISRGVNVAGTVITTPNSCFKVKLNYYFVTATLVTPTEICLNLSDSKNGTYTAHSSQSVEFSSPVELGKAGSVKDRLDVESGTIARNVGYGTISSDNATLEGVTSTRTQFRIALPSNTIYTDSSVVPNLTVVGFETVSQNDSSSAGQTYCRIADTSYFVVFVASGYDLETFLSEYGGTEFTYELATPTTEEISVPSAIEVEPYGTIELIQEQDVEIDTEFSVQYIPDSQYLTKSMVVDNLSSESTDVPLSANQGRILGGLVSKAFKAIANLIQRVGTFLVQYPDSIYGRGEVPSGMAKFAEVKTLRGVSRVGNQLVPLDTTKWTSENVLGSVSSQTIVVKPSTDSTGVYKRYKLPVQSGHTYLVSAKVKTSNANYTAGVALRNSNGTIIQENTSSTTLNPIVFVASTTGSDTHFDLQVQPAMPTSEHGEFAEVILRDLTLYFGSDPSVDVSTLTIADIQQNYPELLTPSAYDAGSLVSTTYEGVKSVGRNLWDEVWEVGSINNSTGQNESTSSTWRGVNYISVSPNVTYYFKTSGLSLRFYWYDADKNFISSNTIIDSELTAPSNAWYLRIRDVTAGEPTYNNNVCVNKSDSQNGTYSPYMTDTLTLPSPVTLRSAGSVADTDELCVEVKVGDDWVYKRRDTQRIGSIDMGDLSFDYNSTDMVFGSTLPLARTYASGLPNLFFALYKVVNVSYASNMEGDKSITMRLGNSNALYFKDSSKNGGDLVDGHAPWLAGQLLYYELAVYDETLSDPILDNFVLTEAGGTITPRQTQTHKIDTSFDIEYLAL